MMELPYSMEFSTFVNMKALKIITLFMFILIGTTSSQNIKCPFQFLYYFGDGTTDIGNSVRVLPLGPLLPPTRYPYGRTFPGRPNDRWSDGRVNIDYVAPGAGLPNIKPYLQLDLINSYDDGVVFSVEGSTVLDTSFFTSRRINVPLYNIPLSTQITWFKKYLHSICTNQRECVKRQPQNSVIVFEFDEANDIGYALVQGKSIDEVKGYVPRIIQSKIDAARTVITMGATRIVYTTATPLGCYPYILTELRNDDPTTYDELGCLKLVNNLIVSMNNDLQTAFNNLKVEFPNVTILGSDYYAATRALINQTSVLGPDGNPALRSCCGIGGKYNYDKKRFCGSLNVPICPNPNNYIYWDGLHFTQEFFRRSVNILLPPALPLLNCTST